MIIENQLTKMDEELKGDYALKFALLRHQLIELLYLAQKYNPNPATLFIGSNSNERLAHSFFALLEAQFPVINLDQGLTMTTPGDFAMALHVHVNHLNKAIKSVTAMSTSAAINNRLITESKNLLKATKWSITEIAYTLGFEESNHFSAFFKRHHGVSPARFRSHSD
ncbi:MAG: helix-turn-helix domain-containing protein [Sphingobacteriales bacterium]|nr:MAG: helix-turn-helix domain-containing protein [Sphingobacteriales bacterium]